LVLHVDDLRRAGISPEYPVTTYYDVGDGRITITEAINGTIHRWLQKYGGDGLYRLHIIEAIEMLGVMSVRDAQGDYEVMVDGPELYIDGVGDNCA